MESRGKSERRRDGPGRGLWQGRCLNTPGWIHGELQDFATALELNRQTVRAAQSARVPDPEVESDGRLNLGHVLLALGRLGEAAAEVQAVERVVRRPRREKHGMRWR